MSDLKGRVMNRNGTDFRREETRLTGLQIIEKPEAITYDRLYELIYQAHENTRKLGIKINTRISNGDQLRESIEQENMTVYVAMLEGKPAGTISTKIEIGKHRFVKGHTVSYVAYVAVLPEYKGYGIGKALCEKAEEYAKNHGADAVGLYVANRNPAAEFYSHIGYEKTEFLPRIKLKQYAVYEVKWLESCSTPKWIRTLYYRTRKAYVSFKYRFDQ